MEGNLKEKQESNGKMKIQEGMSLDEGKRKPKK